MFLVQVQQKYDYVGEKGRKLRSQVYYKVYYGYKSGFYVVRTKGSQNTIKSQLQKIIKEILKKCHSHYEKIIAMILTLLKTLNHKEQQTFIQKKEKNGLNESCFGHFAAQQPNNHYNGQYLADGGEEIFESSV